MKLKIYKIDSYNIYNKSFNYEDLSKLKLFKITNSNKEIIDIIIKIIDENKYKIEENSKNLSLILNPSVTYIPNVYFKFPKNQKNNNDISNLLMNEINSIKEKNKINLNELNNIKNINNELINDNKKLKENINEINKEIKDLKEKIKLLQENNKIGINENKLIEENNIIKEEIKNSKNILEYENFIIATYNIKKDDINKDIRILNCCEDNKKEIEESCQIYLNNEKINFNFFYKFNTENKYTFKFYFNKLLTNTSYLFYECSSLISLDLSNFKTYNVTNMEYMFRNCIMLESINLSNIITNNVIKMNDMFARTYSLKYLDLSSFETNLVTNMNFMFSGCNLNYLNISKFNTSKVQNFDFFFNAFNRNCEIICNDEKINELIKSLKK